jgi:hypothetical protein
MLHVDGSCHCGNIQFEADIDLDKVTICHCTDCQRMTGAAFRTVVPAIKNSFKLLKGKPTTYLKIAESGNRRIQGFCPHCGTSIYATSEFNQEIFGLRVGTLNQRAEIIPKKQIWHRSAMGWVSNIDHLPKFEKQPT